MATVGVYLRVDLERSDEVRAALASMDGLEPFDLDQPGKLGLLIEADDLDTSHDTLVRRVQTVPGVLAAWPVYANFEDEEEDDGIDAS